MFETWLFKCRHITDGGYIHTWTCHASSGFQETGKHAKIAVAKRSGTPGMTTRQPPLYGSLNVGRSAISRDATAARSFRPSFPRRLSSARQSVPRGPDCPSHCGVCDTFRTAPSAARRWHRVVSHDGGMWIIAGKHDGCNLNDVWFSRDGKNWQQMKSGCPWPVRHAPACLVFKNRLWVLGGYDNKGMHNDVWASRNNLD